MALENGVSSTRPARLTLPASPLCLDLWPRRLLLQVSKQTPAPPSLRASTARFPLSAGFLRCHANVYSVRTPNLSASAPPLHVLAALGFCALQDFHIVAQ